jgi:beta-carotene 3-hydroxylase
MPQDCSRRPRCSCRDQALYKVSAIATSSGITAIAITAVYVRFAWHLDDPQDFPWFDMWCTLSLTVGGVVGGLSVCLSV